MNLLAYLRRRNDRTRQEPAFAPDLELIAALGSQLSPQLQQALAQVHDIVERGMRGEYGRPTTFTRKLYAIKGGRA